jgi:hypothetical protein
MDKIYCSHCGRQHSINSKYCSSCGFLLNKDIETQENVLNVHSVRSNSSPSIGTNAPNIIAVKSAKNVGLAVLLAIIFPYFGVLYATVSGFCWLFFSYIGMWIGLFYLGLKTSDGGWLVIGLILSIFHVLVSIIWAGTAASNYNKRITEEYSNAKRQKK